MLGALELGVDDISRAILVTGIDVKMPLFASWLRRERDEEASAAMVGEPRSACAPAREEPAGTGSAKPRYSFEKDRFPHELFGKFHNLTRN